MLKMQQGDEQAFGVIYNETRRGLFAFIMSICRNYATAEDMLQSSYVKLRTTIASYKVGANPYGWLYTIAKNTTLNELNRQKRERSVDMQDSNVDFGSYTMDDEGAPVTALMNKVLNDTEREIVTMHVISGFKHREIADILGKPLGTVLWTYNNALGKMKKALQKENDDEV